MKKFISNAIIIVLLIIFAVSAVGCQTDDIIDKQRTQLYVSNYDGGVGSEWLYAAIERFEEKYAEYEFEPGTGKKGVQVIPELTKSGASALSMNIKGSAYEVFFTDGVYYTDWVAQNLVLDISDIVTEKDENGISIEDRLSQEKKDAYLSIDGNYYMLPNYAGYLGVQYDRDLFFNKRLFFAADRDNGNDGFILQKEDLKSAGPDGIMNTTDDGLPATVEEFYKLMDRMKNVSDVIPFVWSGMYQVYPSQFLVAASNAFAGVDGTRAMYTIDSGGKEIDYITGFDGDSPIIDKTVITQENGDNLFRQPGRYYAIEMLSEILSDPANYHPLSPNTTFSHLDAQEEFIRSSLKNQPIAMLIDGSYWWNEAKPAQQRAVNTYGATRAENRNFAWMQLPGVYSGTVDENNGITPVLSDSLNSMAFINANIKDNPIKSNLAKLFLKFCYSEESLKEFTMITGVTRELDYDLTQQEYSSMNQYARNMWDHKKDSVVVESLSTSRVYMYNQDNFGLGSWKNVYAINNTFYNHPYTALRPSTGINAKQYFQATMISNSDYKSNYSQYFTDKD